MNADLFCKCEYPSVMDGQCIWCRKPELPEEVSELATLRSERDALAAALEEAERFMSICARGEYLNVFLKKDAQQALERIQQIKAHKMTSDVRDSKGTDPNNQFTQQGTTQPISTNGETTKL